MKFDRDELEFKKKLQKAFGPAPRARPQELSEILAAHYEDKKIRGGARKRWTAGLVFSAMCLALVVLQVRPSRDSGASPEFFDPDVEAFARPTLDPGP